ncbi:MAG: T9SS type A sorting domain-containing protein, partial [Crocinitomicaceae bacterium]|nr:T9SS type A sorting domain-containing protein [Crocinitomicaceae bacterium]
YKGTIETDETEISLSNQLSSGTYFVKVTTQTTQKVVRMVKLK